MELFYAYETDGSRCLLDQEESSHAVKVMRHRKGDEINVIDGRGTMYRCIIEDDSPKGVAAAVAEVFPGWGSRPYVLTLAVCPTKNNDRYEWFAEKATELGVDRIVPVIGDRSERKVFKPERLRRIALSAAKQSLKASVPEIAEPVSVKDFIRGCGSCGLRLIAYCFEGDAHKLDIKRALAESGSDNIVVMIGPEGDFSPEEVSLALEKGFLPVTLGPSRLRTETAGLASAAAVYLKYM